MIFRALRDLPRNVVALGVVSMLADAAGDMIAPLLTVFVAGMSGGGPQALGWIEGVAEAVSSFLKLGAGAWSDRIRRRKRIVVLGYLLAAVARPLMAIATSVVHVGLVRALDRTGKGIRTSPRDAMLAHAVPHERRGLAFGFHRALDHAGAVIGPLIAVLLLGPFHFELRSVFWVATIPGALSVIALIVLVREEYRPDVEHAARAPSTLLGARPSREFVRLLVPLALFTLGNASDLFIVLRAREALGAGSSFTVLPLLWLALHAVKGVASIVGGRWTDRYGERAMILSGWIVYALVYAALAFVTAPAIVVALSIAYGCYHGLAEGAEKTLVARLAHAGERGSAFGWYHLTVGVFALPASAGFGWVWERYGSTTAFLASTVLAVAACALLLAWRPGEHDDNAARAH